MIKHTSSRYDVEEMSYNERNTMLIPELKMCWGVAWQALGSSWKGFYAIRRHGDNETATMLLQRIENIRDALRIENQGT